VQPSDDRKTIDVQMKLTAVQARDLLTRLEGDEEFRERMQADPRKTLFEDYGIAISEEAVPEFVLPDPQQAHSLRETLEQYGISADAPQHLGWIAFFEPYAMPLVVTARAGDGSV
jgi:hypothetical protein